MGWLRRLAAAVGLALLGAVGGFMGGLLRRRTSPGGVRDHHAPAARG